MNTPPARERKLDNDAIRLILTQSDLSQRALAKEFGVTGKIIFNVMHGLSYVDVHPELPRRQRINSSNSSAPNCNNCVHHENRCTMGFPEYHRQGDRAASRCNAYATESLRIAA